MPSIELTWRHLIARKTAHVMFTVDQTGAGPVAAVTSGLLRVSTTNLTD